MAISTETIVLKVEAQTDGAIAATNRLAAAQQKLADGFKAAVAGGDDLMQKLGDGLKSLPSAASKVGDVLKGLGFDTRTFSNGLKDIGKGLTFDLIRTGLKSLNGEINSTGKATLSAAVSGASMGAAFGGPIGAAVGALAGGLKGLIGSMSDADEAFKKQREEADKQAKAYWDAINAAEKKKAAEEQLAPALAEVIRHEKELAERAETTNEIMNESADAYRKASDQADAYANKLFSINHEIRERLKLNGQIAGAGIDNGANVGGLQEGEESEAIRASRELRDSETARYAATKSYGDTLIDITKKESTRVDRLRDLEQIMGDVNVSQDVQKRALAEYNDLLKQQNKETDDAIKKAQELYKANLAAWKPALDALKRENEYSDAWRGARVEEAIATAGARHDADVADKTSALEASQPSLENDMRDYDWAEQLKTEKINKAKSRLEDIFGPADDFNVYQSLFKGLEDSVGSAYEAIVTGSSSAGTAFKKMAAASILATGKQASIKAIFELAESVGSLAIGNFAGAGTHALAAAKYGAVAVAAGVAANALGGGGSSSTSSGSGSSPSGGSSQIDHGSGKDERPIYVLVGSAFEGMTPRQRLVASRESVDKALRERDEQ